MSLKRVRLSPAAEGELADTRAWYEQRRPGLGERFLTAFARTTQKIAENPGAWSLVPHLPELPADAPLPRQARVHRFPYRVVYLELADEVRVIAVAHTHREPGYWRDRLV